MLWLTEDAVVLCEHVMGKVQLAASQSFCTINGRKVDFQIVDDKGDPTQAAEIARRLPGQGVVSFVGSISLADCAVNRNYYKQQGIVSIDVGSDATCFNSPHIAPVALRPVPIAQIGSYAMTSWFAR